MGKIRIIKAWFTHESGAKRGGELYHVESFTHIKPEDAFTADVDYVFHVVPIQFSFNYLVSIKKFILREHIPGFEAKGPLPIISLAKGIHLEKLILMHEIFAEVFDLDLKSVTKSLEQASLEEHQSVNHSSIFDAAPAPVVSTKKPSIVPVFLSGPSFAAEICQNLPTGFTVASPDMAIAREIAELVNEDKMSVATMSTDFVGVQVVGALKNVYAIFLGIVDGLGYAYNTKSMFMTLANNELRRITVDFYGGSPRTSQGLAGMGDLVLSCTGPSRNCGMGRKLATGATIKEILASSEGVCEGYPTAKAIFLLLSEKGFIKQCPLIRCIYSIVHLGQPISEVLDYLLSLPVQLDAE